MKPQENKTPCSSRSDTKQKQGALSTCTATAATAEKWKSEMAIHSVSEWLMYNTDKNDKINDMKCTVCTDYEKELKQLPNFNDVFIKGCKNYKMSVIEEHAKSGQHLMAMNLFLKSKRTPLIEHTKTLSAVNPANTDIITGLAVMDKKDVERTKRKFEVAYFVAKQQLSMTKYTEILELENIHGVDIGQAYQTDWHCSTFIDYCGKEIKQQLNSDLAKAKFYSVLCNGSTDNSAKENEVIYALYFDPVPRGSDSLEVKIAFLEMNYLNDQSASGLTAAIKSSFQSIGITKTNKLIGFTSESASLNRGDKNSVKTLLRENSPWLAFIWCIAHRLELAIKNALQGTIFNTIDEMILRLFYLNQKAPKKLRQLRELHEMYKGAMNFLSDSCKPKKASETWWISHKLGAMKTCLDKWGIYIQHLESLAEDKSYKPKDHEKMKRYLRKWKKTEIPFMPALFIDMLEITSILSRSFQADIIDPVYAFRCLSKAKERFNLFDSKEFDKLPHVKDLLRQITVNENDEHIYQNIVLSNHEAAKQPISEKKASLLEKV